MYVTWVHDEKQNWFEITRARGGVTRQRPYSPQTRICRSLVETQTPDNTQIMSANMFTISPVRTVAQKHTGTSARSLRKDTMIAWAWVQKLTIFRSKASGKESRTNDVVSSFNFSAAVLLARKQLVRRRATEPIRRQQEWKRSYWLFSLQWLLKVPRRKICARE